LTGRHEFHIPEPTIERTRQAAISAQSFCERNDDSLGTAMIAEAWFDGSPEAVVAALRTYQNEDGGVGRGLEVDIAAPASNAFAARLAMQVLLGLKTLPQTDVLQRLGSWLEANQADDGDWHFSDETRAGELAPWFAAWEFPALNPACCIAGLAFRLGIATPAMLARVATLFAAKASAEDAQHGDFYTLLPYVEYVGIMRSPERDLWIDRVASAIVATDANGGYSDPQHFFEHAMGSGPVLLERLPADRVMANLELMLDQQTDDGGWPSPYSDAWRPWITASSCVTLAKIVGTSPLAPE